MVSDPEKCNGCGLCELVCSAVNDGKFNPVLSRIRVVRMGLAFRMCMACHLCEDPPCVGSCPYKALKQDEEAGVITVDEERCDGCCWCLEVCEFGAVFLHPERKIVMVCDLCGGNPKCVEYCPKDALEFMTPEQIGQKMRRKTVERLVATKK